MPETANPTNPSEKLQGGKNGTEHVKFTKRDFRTAKGTDVYHTITTWDDFWHKSLDELRGEDLGWLQPFWNRPPSANPFGAPAATAGYGAANPFGAPAATGGYGAAPAANPFGAPAATAGYGAAPAANPFGAPAATAGYGAANPFGAPAATAGYGAAPAANPFGAPAATAGYGAANPFGAPAATAGYGAAPAANPFGAPAATAGYGAANPFGAPAATGGYGAAPAANPFGAPAATAGYGAANPFGAPAATGGYGAAPAANPFGAPAATAGYGAANPFGAPAATAGYGAAPAANPFGAPAATAGYGAANPFGAPAATAGYGAAPAANPFGAPAATAGYGAANPFGAAPAATAGYGAANPFGAAPAATTAMPTASPITQADASLDLAAATTKHLESMGMSVLGRDAADQDSGAAAVLASGREASAAATAAGADGAGSLERGGDSSPRRLGSGGDAGEQTLAVSFGLARSIVRATPWSYRRQSGRASQGPRSTTGDLARSILGSSANAGSSRQPSGASAATGEPSMLGLSAAGSFDVATAPPRSRLLAASSGMPDDWGAVTGVAEPGVEESDGLGAVEALLLEQQDAAVVVVEEDDADEAEAYGARAASRGLGGNASGGANARAWVARVPVSAVSKLRFQLKRGIRSDWLDVRVVFPEQAGRLGWPAPSARRDVAEPEPRVLVVDMQADVGEGGEEGEQGGSVEDILTDAVGWWEEWAAHTQSARQSIRSRVGAARQELDGGRIDESDLLRLEREAEDESRRLDVNLMLGDVDTDEVWCARFDPDAFALSTGSQAHRRSEATRSLREPQVARFLAWCAEVRSRGSAAGRDRPEHLRVSIRALASEAMSADEAIGLARSASASGAALALEDGAAVASAAAAGAGGEAEGAAADSAEELKARWAAYQRERRRRREGRPDKATPHLPKLPSPIASMRGEPPYLVTPSFEKLLEMSSKELSEVRGFEVERPGHGSIAWLEPVDLRDADVNRAVQINPGYAAVDAPESAPARKRLNGKCRVTLFGMEADMLGVPHISEAALKTLTEDLGATFVSALEEETGPGLMSMTWVFEVDHWSGYGPRAMAARAREEQKARVAQLLRDRRMRQGRSGSSSADERGLDNSDDSESEEPETLAQAAMSHDVDHSLHPAAPRHAGVSAARQLQASSGTLPFLQSGAARTHDLSAAGGLEAQGWSARAGLRQPRGSAFAETKSSDELSDGAETPSERLGAGRDEGSGSSIGEGDAGDDDSELEDDAGLAELEGDDDLDNSDTDGELGGEAVPGDESDDMGSEAAGSQLHGGVLESSLAPAGAFEPRGRAAAEASGGQAVRQRRRSLADSVPLPPGFLAGAHGGPAEFLPGWQLPHALGHLEETSAAVAAVKAEVAAAAVEANGDVGEEGVAVPGIDSGVPVDAALVLGRSFRVGWGAGGILAHGARPVSRAFARPRDAGSMASAQPWSAEAHRTSPVVTLELLQTTPTFSAKAGAGADAVAKRSAAFVAEAVEPVIGVLLRHSASVRVCPSHAEQDEARIPPQEWLLSDEQASALGEDILLAPRGANPQAHAAELASLVAALQEACNAKAGEAEAAATRALLEARSLFRDASDRGASTEAAAAAMAQSLAHGRRAAAQRHAVRVFATVAALFLDPAAVENPAPASLEPTRRPPCDAQPAAGVAGVPPAVPRAADPSGSGLAASAARVVHWRRERALVLLRNWAAESLGRAAVEGSLTPQQTPGTPLSLVPGGAAGGYWAEARRLMACGRPDLAAAAASAAPQAVPLPFLSALLAQAGSSAPAMLEARAQLGSWRAEGLLPPTAADLVEAARAFHTDAAADSAEQVRRLLSVARLVNVSVESAEAALEHHEADPDDEDAVEDANAALEDLESEANEALSKLGVALEGEETASLTRPWETDVDSAAGRGVLAGIGGRFADESAQVPRSVAWLVAMVAGQPHLPEAAAARMPWQAAMLAHALYGATAAQGGAADWPAACQVTAGSAGDDPAESTAAWLRSRAGLSALSLPACLARFAVAVRGCAAPVPHPWHVASQPAAQQRAIAGITRDVDGSPTGTVLAAAPMTLREEAAASQGEGLLTLAAHAAAGLTDDVTADEGVAAAEGGVGLFLDVDYGPAAGLACDADTLLEVDARASAADAGLVSAAHAILQLSAAGQQADLSTPLAVSRALVESSDVAAPVPCLRDAVYLLFRLHASSADPALPGAARDMAPAFPSSCPPSTIAASARPTGMRLASVAALFEPEAHGPDTLDFRLPFALLVLLRRAGVLLPPAALARVAWASAAEEAALRPGAQAGAPPTADDILAARDRLTPPLLHDTAERITSALCFQLESQGRWADAIATLMLAAAPAQGTTPCAADADESLPAAAEAAAAGAPAGAASAAGASSASRPLHSADVPGVGGISPRRASALCRQVLARCTPDPASSPRRFAAALHRCSQLGIPERWVHAAAARRLVSSPAPFRDPTLPRSGVPELLRHCHLSRCPSLARDAHAIMVALLLPGLLLPVLEARLRWITTAAFSAMPVSTGGGHPKRGRAEEASPDLAMPRIICGAEEADAHQGDVDAASMLSGAAARSAARFEVLSRLAWLEAALAGAEDPAVPAAEWATGGASVLRLARDLDGALEAVARGMGAMAAFSEDPTVTAEEAMRGAIGAVAGAIASLDGAEDDARSLASALPARWLASEAHHASLQAARGALALEIRTVLYRLASLADELRAADLQAADGCDGPASEAARAADSGVASAGFRCGSGFADAIADVTGLLACA
ncbi:hypothetical protein FNF29_01113 [Cafeteria roenbergensis]|uniref:Peptidase S59 domain-containing protein n=1 Tax=Cafeteria roenbergensis TaxID=33653 RepID=A0A5A8CVU7_CAFRO|nr:hypothetical protein FNF29_01113 [Cafeteria roenbergensis]|eukprot:KAA0156320.1 hypothetical protein FNF29_01113 [Cafeteria roenbergensis]